MLIQKKTYQIGDYRIRWADCRAVWWNEERRWIVEREECQGFWSIAKSGRMVDTALTLCSAKRKVATLASA